MTHWPSLATYRPATAVLAVGTNGWIDPALFRAEPDQAVFTGVMGTLIHAELLGHALRR